MRALRLIAIALPLCAAACAGASADNGLSARLRLNNAQFVPGEIQASTDAPGPKAMASPSVARLYPGAQNIPLAGSVEGGVSVLLGLAGDSGHWIVPAPLLDVASSPDNPLYTFSTRMSLSPETPTGMETLLVRGVDSAGNVGPSQQSVLTVAAPVVPGAMVITLEWDTNADLDLHAVVPVDPSFPLPAGVDPVESVEVWSKAPLALPPSPLGYDKNDPAVAGAGRLDADSNANCVIDGRRQENIVFASPPPAGRYIVRVDAFSMCGQASAQWKVSVTATDGTVPNPATWQAIEADTRGNHGIGAGRLAVDFTR
jgi:hypothetical protein